MRKTYLPQYLRCLVVNQHKELVLLIVTDIPAYLLSFPKRPYHKSKGIHHNNSALPPPYKEGGWWAEKQYYCMDPRSGDP